MVVHGDHDGHSLAAACDGLRAMSGAGIDDIADAADGERTQFPGAVVIAGHLHASRRHVTQPGTGLDRCGHLMGKNDHRLPAGNQRGLWGGGYPKRIDVACALIGDSI